jgi:hypothetical protein
MKRSEDMKGQEKVPAGGFATQRGINYQNRVAAFFAVSCLSEAVAVPGLPRSPIHSIRCETGEPLADILLTFESGGIAFLEVKRTMQITPSRMKPFLSQLIQQYLISKQNAGGSRFPWRRTLDPAEDRLLLLTSSESPESVTKHLANCLTRIGPATTSDELGTVPQNEQEMRALGDFQAMTLAVWKQLMGAEPTVDDVVRLCSLFRIATLDVNPDEQDEGRARATLVRAVVSEAQDSPKAWSSLVFAMGVESETRRTLLQQDIRRLLVDAGFELISSPAYLADIRALREYTTLTVQSLNHLATLSVHGRDVRIERPVTKFLRSQAREHSLVVVGDPGAGKSGALHELGAALQHDDEDVVFLAADRLDDSLKAELGLQHSLSEVLANWSGRTTGTLIIDALDAARGSGALTVLRELIRSVVSAPDSRWRVVASIRVFDLRYSQDLQTIFKRPFGEAAPARFQDKTFPDLRHIHVPRFSPEEIEGIRQLAPELNPVLEAAAPSLRELLDIPFNLRLIAELLSSDLKDSELSAIETQVGLLSQYWLHRVIKSASDGNAREAVLLTVLKTMVAERRLTVSKLRLPASSSRELTDLCSDNVLVEQIANLHGRYIIGFSHHLLFDYAASRLIVAGDFEAFLESLAAERDLFLFLRPSIDLLFKEAWLKDRNAFWSLLRSFSLHDRVPAIAKIVGPAVIPELAAKDDDLSPIVEALSASDQQSVDVAALWVVHVVGALLAGLSKSPLSLWSLFAYRMAQAKGSLRVAAACQSLVGYAVEREEAGETNTKLGLLALNRAAVMMLDRFMQMEPRDPWMVGRTIANVMDLFWINPGESATAIRKLITPREVREKGAEQGHWIARKLPLIFDVDPELAADIYRAFFGYEEKSEEKTSMSGSRILALTSNKRQDYGHTRWQLAQDFPSYLAKDFDRCSSLVAFLVNYYIESEGKARGTDQVVVYRLGDVEHTVIVDYSSIWDGSSVRDEVQNIADTYFRKLEEMGRSGNAAEKVIAAATQLLSEAKYVYTPRQILKLAKATPAVMMPVVYPLMVSESALLSYDLSSEIGEALKVGFASLSESQRLHVERAINRLPEGATGDVAEAKGHIRDRLLGCLPKELISLQESTARLDALAVKGGAPENRERHSGGVWVSPYSPLDRMRERGIPVDEPQNVKMRTDGEELWKFAQRFTNSVPKLSDVAQVEHAIPRLRDELRSAAKRGVHSAVMDSAEAQLIAACAAGAKCKEMDCTSPQGLIIKEILIAGLKSPQPEPREGENEAFDRAPAWGAPIQRIEAAAGLGTLLGNESCLDDVLFENVRKALVDPVPAVRFQVVIRLLPLHSQHLDELWEILRELARSERSTGVLGSAMYSVINPLAGRYRAEVVELIQTILSRNDLPNEGGDAVESCYRTAAGLYIWQGDARAYALISPIVEGDAFSPERAGKCLMDIRGTLTFASDVPKATDAEIRRRSFELVDTIAHSALARVEVLIQGVTPAEREAKWQNEFQDLARLIDYIGNQLFFSSGAFDGTNSDSAKSLDESVRRTFWQESQNVMSTLAKVAIPSVAHHLIETLESFIPFAPADVFHEIANVVKSAKNWGYQYESLAVDLLVKVTERYLAEERMTLLQDVQCREELIDILEAFVIAGWPSARRLSYRLEEIFR